MKRLLNTMWLLALCPILLFGQGLQRYEYWVDEDYSQRRTVNSSATDITLSVDIGGQPAGLHYLNFRSQNTDGDWSFINRYLYYVPDQPSPEATLKGYEYWIDDDYSTRKRVNNTSGSYTIVKSIKNLPVGLHYFNFRALNSNNDWGSLNRYLFYVPEKTEVTATLTKYEYWIDDDYSTRKLVNNDSGNYTVLKNIKDLSVGLHYFNFRACNSNGDWGCLNRYLFYVPDEDPDAAEGPIVAYRYNFNQVCTYVPIGEQMTYQMQDFVINIPPLSEIGNLETGCEFSFNEATNMAHLDRTQLVTFGLQFQKKSGGLSIPVSTSFTMSDNLDREMLPLPLNGSVLYDKVPIGDYGAFRIDLEEEEALQINASQQCTIQIWDEYGYLISSFWSVGPRHSAALALADGTYYGVVYNMVKNEDYPKDQLKVKLLVDGFIGPVTDSDDLQDFIDGIDEDEQGTEAEPIVVPVSDDGLLVNGETDIVDDLQLFIDGGTSSSYQMPICFAGGTIELQSPTCGLRYNNVRFCNKSALSVARAVRSTGGGINNSGKLTLTESTLENGNYVITNLPGGRLWLCSNTQTAGENELIVNSGDVYLDGTVTVGALRNCSGGRIYVTSALTKDVKIVIGDASDVEEKIPVVQGAEGYTLTTADMNHIHFVLPDGYGRRFDKTAMAIVIYELAELIGDVNNDTKVSITDAVGLVNCILGNPSVDFNEDAADVNGDGVITITDAVGVVNIILNQSSSAPVLNVPVEPEMEQEPE